MINNVVIVGGGTAGWMTASYLSATFGPQISVTLVESKNVPTIGVGEATFSTIRHFFAYLGLEERDWMPECSATYKLAIRFENWREPGHHFYHPFERARVIDGFPITDWWLRQRGTGHFDDDCFVIPALCEKKSSPRFLDGRIFEQREGDDGSGLAGRSTMTEQRTQFPYAYHFDAALLARYLTRYGTARGVRHVLDDVTDVVLDQRGWISHVTTAEHGELHGDLFIDCTGFRGMLINKALEEPFQSYQETLPNDSAVALRVPLDMASYGLRPCTTATAQDAGWIWTIPLFGRIGTGYVYARDYTSPDEAERTLREFVGPAAEGMEANHIRMRIGRTRNAWVRNCVSIGLSAGFVEPLESTGIFFIQNGIEQLVKHFPDKNWNDQLRTSYNSHMARMMDGVREFLVMHYYAARRENNQYWKDAKTRPLPDGLAERIENWKVRLPDSQSIFPYYHGFESYSYHAMLLGLGGLPLQAPAALSAIDGTAAEKAFELIGQEARDLTDQLPSQYEYFAHLRKLPTP
ncbi:tryptophan halogenase family protein [Micromonospora deserti]|uniref:Tryptophan halogenase n=1 Tax=Micromonospora deserti TaxID=2070366 RepID=A0A2W2DLV9_9ACTN|nr:tryptophan halogenase family protein [Micromonospora deserti]PZG01830.1 tryptophan halogenase [Micromonospora deserti]